MSECASELWLLTHPDLRQTARVKVIYQLLMAQLELAAGILDGSDAGPPAK